MADIDFNNDHIQLGRDLGIIEQYLFGTTADEALMDAYERIARRFIEEEVEEETLVETASEIEELSEEDDEPSEEELEDEAEEEPVHNPRHILSADDAQSQAAAKKKREDEEEAAWDQRGGQERDPADEIKDKQRLMRRWTPSDDEMIVGFLRTKQRPEFILDELNSKNPDNHRTIGALNQRIYKLKADNDL